MGRGPRAGGDQLSAGARSHLRENAADGRLVVLLSSFHCPEKKPFRGSGT